MSNLPLLTSTSQNRFTSRCSVGNCKEMDIGGMSYTMINVGEGTGGGMMKHPVPGAPSPG
jgi:hypothetical protein